MLVYYIRETHFNRPNETHAPVDIYTNLPAAMANCEFIISIYGKAISDWEITCTEDFQPYIWTKRLKIRDHEAYISIVQHPLQDKFELSDDEDEEETES